LTGLFILVEEFILRTDARELSAPFGFGVDYSAPQIFLFAEIFRAKATRHKTVDKADNIARLQAAATRRPRTLRG